ncbi:MAG: outer membrane beta-barrel protein [Bacteroidales bacterium]
MRTRLLFILMFIMGSASHGQTIFLKFGPSFSKITSTATPGASPVIAEKGIVGFDAIAGVNYLNRHYFYLSSGIGFLQGGGEEELVSFGSPYVDEKVTVRLNFMTVNTTFNLKIPIKEIIEPYIFAGPRMDYLVSYSHLDELFNTHPGKNYIIYGALLGGGINFKFKKIQFGLGCDYYLNLTKIVDNQKHDEQVSVNTFTVNALIGYTF